MFVVWKTWRYTWKQYCSHSRFFIFFLFLRLRPYSTFHKERLSNKLYPTHPPPLSHSPTNSLLAHSQKGRNAWTNEKLNSVHWSKIWLCRDKVIFVSRAITNFNRQYWTVFTSCEIVEVSIRRTIIHYLASLSCKGSLHLLNFGKNISGNIYDKSTNKKRHSNRPILNVVYINNVSLHISTNQMATLREGIYQG